MSYLTPDEIPEATDCRSLLIPANSEWLGLVSGAINELAKPYNWEQFGAVTPDEAAARALEMWQAFVDSGCSGGCTIYRTNPITLTMEVSFDDGETYEPYEMPPVPERPVGETDPECMAAINAAHAIGVLYETVIDQYNIDTSFDLVLGSLATGIGLAISSLFGAPVAAIISAGTFVFSLAYQTLDVLLTDYWTPDVEDRLACILKQNASTSVGVVSFDGGQVVYDLRTEFFRQTGLLNIPQCLVWEQIVYLVSILGQDGLNHAGGTTAIETYDCGDCGSWDYWLPLNKFAVSDVYVPLNAPSNSCGTAWAATPAGAIQTLITFGNGKAFQSTLVSALHRMALRIEIELPADTTVTYIQFWTVGASVLRLKYNGVQVRCGAPVSSSDWAPNQTGGLFQFNMGATASTTAFRLERVRIQGTGRNPFADKLGESYPAP